MQKCPCCGKEIRFIATSRAENVTCDAEIITVYNEFGRKISGHKVHECEKEKNENNNPGER